MAKPRILGYIAANIVSLTVSRLAKNQRATADLLIHNYHGDKDAVAQIVKELAENDALAWRALTLLQAGQLHEAEELLLGSGK